MSRASPSTPQRQHPVLTALSTITVVSLVIYGATYQSFDQPLQSESSSSSSSTQVNYAQHYTTNSIYPRKQPPTRSVLASDNRAKACDLVILRDEKNKEGRRFEYCIPRQFTEISLDPYELTLLVSVFASSSELSSVMTEGYKRRQTIRSTWANRTTYMNDNNREGEEVINKKKSHVYFMVETQTWTDVAEEFEQFQDVFWIQSPPSSSKKTVTTSAKDQFRLLLHALEHHLTTPPATFSATSATSTQAPYDYILRANDNDYIHLDLWKEKLLHRPRHYWGRHCLPASTANPYPFSSVPFVMSRSYIDCYHQAVSSQSKSKSTTDNVQSKTNEPQTNNNIIDNSLKLVPTVGKLCSYKCQTIVTLDHERYAADTPLLLSQQGLPRVWYEESSPFLSWPSYLRHKEASRLFSAHPVNSREGMQAMHEAQMKVWLDSHDDSAMKSIPFPLTLKHKVVIPGYNDAPIVVPQYKLLFFTEPKVACTMFKMLFRRMYGYQDWKTVNHGNLLHSPSMNGLKYLAYYPLDQAKHMLTSPQWTRAIFLREPKDRLLSAYLDKAVNKKDIQKWCCVDSGPGRPPRKTGAKEEEVDQTLVEECKRQVSSFPGFVEVVKNGSGKNVEENGRNSTSKEKGMHGCQNEHWRPYASRIDDQAWSFINFVGSFSNIAHDIELLIKTIGGNEAWNEFGASGWGEDGKLPICETQAGIHATKATDKLKEYYGQEEGLEKKVEKMYAEDYRKFDFGVGPTEEDMTAMLLKRPHG